jgi:hypothetical protein
MFPNFSSNDCRYFNLGNAILLRQFNLRMFPGGIFSSNFFNRIFTKNMNWRFFSAFSPHSVFLSGMTNKSPLSYTILLVIFGRSKKQMKRIYAKFNIALMAYKKAFCNFSKNKFPCCSVRGMWPVVNTESPVSIFRFSGFPQPAIGDVENVHLAPKKGLLHLVDFVPTVFSRINTLRQRAVFILFSHTTEYTKRMCLCQTNN